jgi:hypothetical protein
MASTKCAHDMDKQMSTESNLAIATSEIPACRILQYKSTSTSAYRDVESMKTGRHEACTTIVCIPLQDIQACGALDFAMLAELSLPVGSNNFSFRRVLRWHFKRIVFCITVVSCRFCSFVLEG